MRDPAATPPKPKAEQKRALPALDSLPTGQSLCCFNSGPAGRGWPVALACSSKSPGYPAAWGRWGMGYGTWREWTPDEKKRLADLASAGLIDNDIAEAMDRPVRAVSAQRMLMGIPPNRR